MDPSPSPTLLSAPEPLFFLDGATAVRPGGAVALRDVSWSVRPGECWAVVGPVGAGKTSLAQVLLGRCRIVRGAIGWPFLDHLRAAGRPVAWPAEVIHHVAFKEESWLFSHRRHYYQQRFNFVEPHEDLTLQAFLQAGNPPDDTALQRIAGQLGIAPLLGQSLIKLSNGQLRRARLARALLAQPAWLILDEPFMGLDRAGQEEVAHLLGALLPHGPHLLLITRADRLPPWVTHVLELHALTVSGQGRREKFRLRLPAVIPPAVPAAAPAVSSPAEPILEMRHVTVRYGAVRILDDVSWTVRRGERWAVLGPNGSGKSTLLSLICADHPQAYSNDIWLFGRPRGSGESIWEIKQQIGLVSPELHLYFSEPLTAAQTAATGFFDVVSYRPTTPEQEQRVRDLFAQFQIAALLDRPFASLSTGEQRLVLLLRALVKDPPLLVLDEPFQGLDEGQILRARHWLDERVRAEQTLLFVSHDPREIPQTVHRLLRLDAGRVVERR